MKAGCFLSIALLAGLVLGEHAWIYQRLPIQEAWIGSGILGVIAWLCLGSLWRSWESIGIIRALRNARDGVPPGDGELVAISGSIHPHGDPILAPLTETPCVAYEYEISRRNVGNSDSSDQTVVDFAGIGMAPCELRSEDRVLALYGFPDLEEIAFETCGPGARRNAELYVRRAPFEDCSGLRVITGFGKMLNALTTPGEEIRRDFRMIARGSCPWLQSSGETASPAKANDYSPSIQEKRLAIGETLLAIGLYDAAAEALVTRSGSTFRRTIFKRTTVGQALSVAQSEQRLFFWGGLIALVVSHAIGFGIVLLAERNAQIGG